jgi:mRNA-degrading endonuclease RelE of RelBE toxin-antitoxin system
VFEIRFAEGVEEDLRSIRIYYRNQILDPVEEQFAHEPDTSTRNRKLLENLIPPWQTVAPIRELRVGEYRVFYDVSPADESVVYVRSVRRKPRGTKTEDILKTVKARDLTRPGKPAPVMVGVEEKDWEHVVLQTSSTFWKFIEERRKEPTMSMKELRTRLKKRKK